MAGLFNAFISEENFIAAYKRVAAKGSRGGIDGVTVAEFGHNLKRNLAGVRREIESGSYIPQAVESVSVPKFNEANEWRELGLPTVADKVVQAALLQVVEPLAEKKFIDSSYAYRQGKGHTKAVRRVEHFLKQEHSRWVAIQDIDNFFDTIDHDRLLDGFSHLVGGEERLVALVALWARTGIVARDGQWKNVEAGVRQGQIISPLLANLYLHPLDEFARNQGWGWVRYADNYLILGTDEDTVRDADRQTTAFLAEPLRLRLNRNDNPVRSLDEGFVFLGISFHGVTRAIAGEKMAKIKRKLAWILSPKGNADIQALLRELTFKVDGWRRYYGFLKPAAQFAEIEQWLESGLTKLVGKRVAAGVWPREAPEGICPMLTGEQQSPEDGRKRLMTIWRNGAALALADSKEKADRLVNKRRKRHQREQVVTGELVVTTPGYFVGRRGGRIVVRKQQTVVSEILGIQLRSITIASHGVAISSDVVSYCTDRDIFINCIDSHGRVIAVTHKPDGVRAELAFLQAKERDTVRGQHLARFFVTGKMNNQLALLKSYAKYGRPRKNGFGAAFAEELPVMRKLLDETGKIQPEANADTCRQRLMGFEGIFGAIYWKVMRTLLPEDVVFTGREHQGATDLVNSLLNYGYGILYSQALNAVVRAGLNAQAGFLHSYQAGKPVLVFDLVEEFRAEVVDRPVFSMLNRRETLEQTEDGLLCEAARKRVAARVLSRLGLEVTHQGCRQTLREVLDHQAMAIRRFLLGGERYYPFHARW